MDETIWNDHFTNISINNRACLVKNASKCSSHEGCVKCNAGGPHTLYNLFHFCADTSMQDSWVLEHPWMQWLHVFTQEIFLFILHITPSTACIITSACSHPPLTSACSLLKTYWIWKKTKYTCLGEATEDGAGV